MPKGSKSIGQSKDMEGHKIARLTVLRRTEAPERSRKGDTSARWLCRCDCGKETIVSRRAMLSGKTQSCGCLRIEMNRAQAKALRAPGITAPLKRMVRSYKWNAFKRGLKFCLSEELFLSLISQPCYWCGANPSQQLKTIRGNDKENILIYNGIDRLHNYEGYTYDNSVPSCGTCNKMKSDLSESDFLSKIKQIYERHL